SSIYGGNLPTTPYCVDSCGRGPAWSNSLFEDNAEYGFGQRMAADFLWNMARQELTQLGGQVGQELTDALINGDQSTHEGIHQQRLRVEQLRQKLQALDTPEAHRL